MVVGQAWAILKFCVNTNKANLNNLPKYEKNLRWVGEMLSPQNSPKIWDLLKTKNVRIYKEILEL